VTPRSSCAALALAGLVAAGAAAGVFDDKPCAALPSVGLPRALCAADFDADGRADLAVAAWTRADGGKGVEQGKGRVLVFLQKPDGGLAAAPVKTLSVAAPLDVAAGDYDGDGKPDLAVLERRRLSLFLSADGFQKPISQPNVNHGSGLTTLQATRLDPGARRGADFLSGPVLWRWRGGDGFQAGYFSGPTASDNGLCVAADLFLSGASDLVFLSGPEARVYAGPILSLTPKTSDLAEYAALLSDAGPLRSLAAGDVTGDGRPDIVASAAGKEGQPGQILIFRQNAPLGFCDKAGPSARIPCVSGELRLSDVNKDGLLDLLVCDARGAVHVLAQRQGKGLPPGPDQTLDVDAACFTVGNLALGRPALVVGQRKTGRILVFAGAKTHP